MSFWRYVTRPYELLYAFLDEHLANIDTDSLLLTLLGPLLSIIIYGIALLIPIVCLIVLIGSIRRRISAQKEHLKKEGILAVSHTLAAQSADAIKRALPPQSDIYKIELNYSSHLTVWYWHQDPRTRSKRLDSCRIPLDPDAFKWRNYHFSIRDLQLELAHELAAQYPFPAPAYLVDWHVEHFSRETGQYRVESRFERADNQSVTRVDTVTPIKDSWSESVCEIRRQHN